MGRDANVLIVKQPHLIEKRIFVCPFADEKRLGLKIERELLPDGM